MAILKFRQRMLLIGGVENVNNNPVKINSKDFTKTSGDTIGFQATPNQAATTTGEIFGAQIKPRLANTLSAGGVTGVEADAELKGTGATTITGDLRGFYAYLGAAAAAHVIGGDVVGLRVRAEISTNPTGHIIMLKPIQHEGSQGWDGLIKFDAALGTHSMTTNADKTGNAKSGTIKVICSDGSVKHIQLYAD